ncbi:MAG: polyphenol oxidase family protein [bacterium]
MLNTKAAFPIFFGDKHTCPVDWRTPEFHTCCIELAQKLGATHLIALKQVHGTDGLCIDNTSKLLQDKNNVQSQDITNTPQSIEKNVHISLYKTSGDYLITNQKNVAIAVVTADCLPIIIHDSINNAVAVIHAGWPGTVTGITEKALRAMQEAFGTDPAQVHVYFGPSAKTCCYEVQENFYAKFSPIPAKQLAHIEQSIISRDNKLFFDNPGCNKLILHACGVPEAHIHTEHNICTICHHEYHSYRRDKENALRQLTMTTIT